MNYSSEYESIIRTLCHNILSMKLLSLNKTKLVLLLALLTPQLVIAVRGYAADEEYCTDYVIISIAQYWQSVDEDCGFSGSRWSSDFKLQYDWCLKAHDWVADNETEARDRMLDECRAAASVASTDSSTSDLSEELTKQLTEQPNINDNSDAHEVSPAIDNSPYSHDKTGNVGVGDNLKGKITNVSKVYRGERSLNHSLDKALWYAVAENDLATVQSLVSDGANIHYKVQDIAFMDELKMARHSGSLSGVASNKDTVVTIGDVSPVNTNVVVGNTVNNEAQASSTESESMLSYAVSKGLVDVGLWLLKQEAGTLNEAMSHKLKKDLLGIALINAVKNKQSGNVMLLLEKGANIDYDLDMNFGTPLYFAVTKGVTKIAKILLSKGANSNYTTNGGQNMLNYSVDNIELLGALLDHGADPNSNGESAYSNNLPLVHAIKLGNAQAVRLLLKHGARTDMYDVQEPYPLLQAIAEQHSQIVELLIKHGADVNVVYNSDSSKSCAVNDNNFVPLDEAIKTGNDGIVLLLKQAGAKTEKEICSKP